MNNIEQSSRPFVPLPKGSQEQVTTVRKRLEDVFGNVSLVRDVVTLCAELSEGSSGDFNSEIAQVLRRCAADNLHFQIEALTEVIECLPGATVSDKVEAATTGRATT